MKNPEVVTIGLGYIGLPTSALIASHGTKVLGVDLNQTVVDTVNQGEIHIVEPDLDEIVSKAVSDGFFQASTKASAADVYLIVVPTPFKRNHEPDISFVKAAAKAIIPLLKNDNLIIIESTSPVGTTEKIQNLIFGTRPELEGLIHLAYCPERVLPGNVLQELVENDRIIGGIDKGSTQKAISFYKKYVTGTLHGTNAQTAEMCKLVENSSRDVQIAFANEISLICSKAGINVWELINLANKHPRVNILKAGCGVGGHCIAVDPYFIVSDYPMESKIIRTAREVNNYKSFWCVEKIKNEKLQFEIKHGRSPKISLMGLAFKANIDDLRESPASYIADKVLQGANNEETFVVEPNIDSHDLYNLTDYKYAADKSDIIVFLVGHKEFVEMDISDKKRVIDFCGIRSDR
ncbi:UDP-N-acetyl-D-mannosamine dehydrogenase [Akkermansiaceae bacterium]|nr:UDP-N-acetyl-D-mannosamine dehydrogenase [Akkermansiaceae bacterium]